MSLEYREVYEAAQFVKGGQWESIEFAADEGCRWTVAGVPLEQREDIDHRPCAP